MSSTEPTRVAIACQGGGSHTAFTAGVLMRVLRDIPDRYEISALTGTSGGAINAAIAWDGLRRTDVSGSIRGLEEFWHDIAATSILDRAVNDSLQLINRLTDQFGRFETSPYFAPPAWSARARLRGAIDERVDFGPVANEGAPSPGLYVGAVDVKSGEFVIFEDGEAGVDGVLASAALPTIFPAVDIDGVSHWDGLFSHNPPMRIFLSGMSREEKPDEIWLVRINPVERADVPVAIDEILDRRNELTANLSAEQEIHTIETINKLVASGYLTDSPYKHIGLREVELRPDLELYTKTNRDPEFIETLIDRGRARGDEFWT